VEELEQWIIELGANPKDEASVQCSNKKKIQRNPSIEEKA
jgi:hypothetical protein